MQTSSSTLLVLGLAALAAAPTVRAASAPISPEAHDFFENKIRPVLVAECYECHNARKTKGGLRLDYRAGWQKGGDTGDAIVPGDPKKSLLIDSIKHTDPDLKMPDKAPKLDDAIIADFEKWVAMGAPDPRDEPPAEQASKPSWADLLATRRSWWSLQPVAAPAPPAAAPENPIDRFLAAKLEAKGLTPAAPADPRTLLRRLTFTLTGLPPTPAEVDAFCAEFAANRPTAQAAATDRLLASPRFGEHWGRHWLDLMRYAETHGSESDPEIREAWRFRDYIIRALNADVPVDQLIREHLAGDLLPRPRMNPDGFNESMLGIASLRLGEHGFQPVDTLDDQVKTIDNQIDVVSKAFQGLTISCARCHDHKFDAISQHDFQALYSIFASVRPAQVTIDAPEVQATNRAELEQLHGRIATALAEAWLPAARKLGERLLGESTRAEEAQRAAEEIRGLEQQIVALDWTARRTVTATEAPREPAPSTVAPLAVWAFEKDAADSLGRAPGRLEGGAEIRNGRLILNGRGAYFHTDALPKTLRAKTLEAWVSPATLEQRGGGVLAVETTREHGFDAIVFAEKDARQWVAGSNFFKRSERLSAPEETAKPGEFVHLAVTYAADGTVAFYRDGQPYGASYTKPPLLEFPADGARVLLGLRHKGAGSGFFAGEIEEARVYDVALSAEQVAASFHAGTPAVVSEEQIVAALTPEQRAQRADLQARLTTLRAQQASNEPTREAWSEALQDAATEPANPLHLWTKLSALPQDRFAAEWSRLSGELQAKLADARAFNGEHFRPMWNLATADYAQWFPYGSGLTAQPLRAGAFSITPTGDRVLDGVYPAGTLTNRLSDKHNGLLTSPRFKIETDSISVYAGGGGGAMVRVIVDNYPLPSNPIFPKAILDSDRPGWVRLDTAYRKGSWAYLEFGTRDDLTRPLAPPKNAKAKEPRSERSHFFASEVVSHQVADKPRELALATQALLGGPAPRDAAALATRYGEVAADAVRAWRDGQLSESQTALLDFLVRNAALPVTLDDLQQVRPLVEEYRRLETAVPILRHAPGVIETTGFDAPFLTRGDHLKPGEPVPRGYLAVLDRVPYRTPISGRLELAEDIASSKNPLTARVMVNRVWHWMFGRGIVATVDNFGRLGDKPTHPELLDFLAARFIQEGWSMKKLIREIALTQAFQMGSEPSPQAREIDPTNELLSHFRVRRLEAESIRDSLLAVSGELSPEMFGFPADALAPRRSVYLQVKRTNLNPFLQTFDAPKPFTTLGRRDATNVPGQSLTMLNSAFVIEQAQKWSRRLVREGGTTVDDRVRAMFATAFARTPGDDELDAARLYLEALATDHQVKPEQALASEPVWQDFAQSIFNLKEFIYLR